MLNFLKKILQNEKQYTKREYDIPLQNLEEWLNEKSKPLLEDVKIRIEGNLMQVNEELQRARINVEVLENAKLQNPNIPFKAKQYMEGNRKAYIRSVNSFLGHLEINNKDYFYLVEFCKLFDELIDELNKGTLRSYTILQEFFSNETEKIAGNLRNFDNLFRDLKSILNDKKMVAVNSAVEKAQNLKSRIRQKISLDIDLKGMEAELKLVSAEKETTLASIENFDKSDEHNNFLKLNEEKKSKIVAFYNDQNIILQSFSVLERPLRKYSHVAFEHEEFVLDYLKNPIEAIISDKNLVILEILGKLAELLNEGKIQVDDRKKEKAVEEIRRLSKEFIGQFIKKYFSFKSEVEEIDHKMKLSGVTEKFRNFNRNLEKINISIEKFSEEYEKLKSDSLSMNRFIENVRSDIENSMKTIFNEEVKVSC